MNYKQMAKFLPIFTVIVLIGNIVNYFYAHKADGFGAAIAEGGIAAIPGLIVLLAIVVVGVAIHAVIPWKGLPAVAYIVTLGCLITVPGFPGAELFAALVKKVNFMVLCTPILAYAGLAICKDLDLLKKQGWKIVLVGLFVFIGTFIGSAIIAELVMRATGKI